jgi:hypothetical protein
MNTKSSNISKKMKHIPFLTYQSGIKQIRGMYMIRKCKRVKVVILVSMLMLYGFLGLAFVTVSSENGTEDQKSFESCGNSRATDYISDYYPSGLGTVYAGEENINFYVRIYHNYNGEELDPGSDYHPEYDWLHNMKIYFGDVVDGNGNPVTPITWDRKNADNSDGSGYDTSYSRYFYYDDDGNIFFQFDINNQITPAVYYIKLTIKYRLITNYDSINDITSYSSERTTTRNIQFEIRSGLWYNTPYNTYDVEAYDDEGDIVNSGLFYAGSEFQEARIYITGRAWDDDSILKNLEASCGTPSGISHSDSDSEATIVEIYQGSTSFFRFRIDINSASYPGIYTCSLSLSYKRGINGVEKTVSEKVTAKFIVDFTPVLDPPDSGINMNQPVKTFYQGDPEGSFTVEFMNNGNVDLRDIEISLDVSDAQYFSSADYYFDEGNEGDEVYFPLTASIESLDVGYSDSVTFTTSVFKQLPQGVYLIPVKYQANYYDSGELVGSSGYVSTDEQEFQDVKTAMRYDNPYDQPFICIKIVDSNGLDLSAKCLENLTAGEQNAKFNVKIQNLEYYSLMNLETRLNIGGSTPLTHPTEPSEPFLDTIYISSLGQYDPQGTGDETTITFIANINEDAIGTYYIPLEITGNDTHNNYVTTKNLELKLIITPNPPKFIVTSVSTSEIAPGENFDLDIYIKNIGSSEATNIEVNLLSSSNVFSLVEEGSIFSDSLATGEETVAIFNMKANSNLDAGSIYYVDLEIKYQDVLDNVRTVIKHVEIKTGEYTPPPPCDVIVVTNMKVTEIRAGQSFTLTVYLRNVGDVDIKNAFVILSPCTPLIYHSGVSSTQTGVVSTGTLGPGNQTTAVFQMEADPNIAQGKEYNCSLIVTYKDNLGITSYKSHCIKDIQLKVEYEGKTAEELQEEAIKTEKATIDMSLLLFAIIMLIGIIIIAVVLGGIFKRLGGGKSKDKKSDADLPVIQPPAVAPSRAQSQGPRVLSQPQQYQQMPQPQQYNQQQLTQSDQEVFY